MHRDSLNTLSREAIPLITHFLERNYYIINTKISALVMYDNLQFIISFILGTCKKGDSPPIQRISMATVAKRPQFTAQADVRGLYGSHVT